MNTRSHSRNKRGLLFTVVTFLLLSGLLSFSLFYLASTNEMSSSIYSLDGDRLRALDSDIGESLLDILDSGLASMERFPGRIEITFSSLPLVSSGKDYAPEVSGYESFLEADFNAIANSRIDLSLGPGLEIMPWNISIIPSGASLYVHTGNASAMQGMRMELRVTEKIANLTDSGSPPDQGAGNPQIHVIIRDEDSTDIINANPRLTAGGSWTFHADFDGGSGIDVIFGAHAGRQGTLRIAVGGLNATIGETEFDYDIQGEAFISPAGSYLTGLGGLRKDRNSFLFEGD